MQRDARRRCCSGAVQRCGEANGEAVRPPGNQNARGHGAPYGNRNALKTGEHERIILVFKDGRVLVSQGLRFSWFRVSPEMVREINSGGAAYRAFLAFLLRRQMGA